jgi:tetratricopeptide (TPR) repeat protein
MDAEQATTFKAPDAGLTYTASQPTSVTSFETAITSYLAARTDTMQLLDALVAEDPQMPMAVLFKGYLLKLAAHPRFAAPLEACVAHARGMLETRQGTDREQAHAAALIEWCSDRGDTAARTLEALLQRHPTDMLALRIAHYLHFYSGDGNRMRDSIKRVFDAWSEDHPDYGYLLGMYAFALEEAGEYTRAEQLGREAVAANAADIWATHAVTHVFEMQDRHSEGIKWLATLRRHWHGINNFRYHVIWHEALHCLGLGQLDRALDIYDVELAPSTEDDFYLDLCNNAAMLWRLEFLGVDVGERWRPLAEIALRHTEDRELVFASLHYLIPLAVTRSDGARALLQTLGRWAESGTDQGRVCTEVGLNLADAVTLATSQPGEAAALLTRCQPRTCEIGGSKAQRDLFRLLAMDSARKAKHGEGRTP